MVIPGVPGQDGDPAHTPPSSLALSLTHTPAGLLPLGLQVCEQQEVRRAPNLILRAVLWCSTRIASVSVCALPQPPSASRRSEPNKPVPPVRPPAGRDVSGEGQARAAGACVLEDAFR